MKMWCLSAYPKGIQDVGDFVSSVEHKQRFLTQPLQSVSHIMSVNGTTALREKNIHRQNQIKPCSSWQYPCGGSEVKNINTVQFLAQTDCFMSLDINVSSRAAGFHLVLSVVIFFFIVFLTLKAMSPIDCHYMTDRLQRFELKIFICVLLKKQSHLHLRCPGGKQINIIFGWTVPLMWQIRHIKIPPTFIRLIARCDICVTTIYL